MRRTLDCAAILMLLDDGPARCRLDGYPHGTDSAVSAYLPQAAPRRSAVSESSCVRFRFGLSLQPPPPPPAIPPPPPPPPTLAIPFPPGVFQLPSPPPLFFAEPPAPTALAFASAPAEFPLPLALPPEEALPPLPAPFEQAFPPGSEQPFLAPELVTAAPPLEAASGPSSEGVAVPIPAVFPPIITRVPPIAPAEYLLPVPMLPAVISTEAPAAAVLASLVPIPVAPAPAPIYAAVPEPGRLCPVCHHGAWETSYFGSLVAYL